MPLSSAEKTQLQSDVQTISDAVSALVVDTVDVAALQQQVADLTAANQALQTQLNTANASVANLTGKIAAAKTAAQADKDADDAREAGQGVLDALA